MQGRQVRRYSHTIALEAALLELMRLYDRYGGTHAPVPAQIEAEIERCLGQAPAAREGLQARMQQLLRTRDLHHYLSEDAELVPLKLRLYELLLEHRSAAECWAAVRALLLEQVDRICETPLPGLAANLELYRRCLSDRSSRLGKLLLTTALFNLDRDGEKPPPNLLLHFRRGRFPHHWWEICTPGGRTAHLGTLESWVPSQPLSRWEYLATDLACALLRDLQHAPAQHRWERGAPAPAPGHNPATPEPEAVYLRFDADATGEAPAQMELFPLEGGTLLTGLLHRVQRRQGPHGARLLAALCAWLGRVAPGETVELPRAALAAEAGGGDTSLRGLRTRMQRLERIVAELQQVELTRVRGTNGASRARTTRLLAVLGRGGAWSDAPRGPAPAGMDTALLVLPDPCLLSGPDSLAAAFRDLPAPLLASAGREHPHLLPLYLYLRRCWSGSGGPGLRPVHPAAASPVVEHTARALFEDAGIWIPDTGRYRAIEALKRDLEFMREQGWLGSWRLQRSDLRDALEDRYRLQAPGPAAAPVPLPLRPGMPAGGEALTGS